MRCRASDKAGILCPDVRPHSSVGHTDYPSTLSRTPILTTALQMCDKAIKADPRLAALILTWNELPPDIRTTIMTLVRSSAQVAVFDRPTTARYDQDQRQVLQTGSKCRKRPLAEVRIRHGFSRNCSKGNIEELP
jgi:hypothetical protein